MDYLLFERKEKWFNGIFVMHRFLIIINYISLCPLDKCPNRICVSNEHNEKKILHYVIIQMNNIFSYNKALSNLSI